MKKIVRPASVIISQLVFIIIATEILVRIFSSFTNIYDIEMLKYAQELKTESEMVRG